MHIAIVTRKLSGRGGMETAIRSLVDAASRDSNLTFEMWLMGHPHQRQWLEGLTYRETNIDQGTGKRLQLKAKLLFYGFALKRWLKKYPIDVIIATDPVFIKAAIMARGDATGPKVLSWIHFSLDAVANIHYLREADGHLAISSGIAEQIRQLHPKAAPTIVFNSIARIPAIADALPWPPLQLLYIGRLNNRQKRVDVLLDGLAELRGIDWSLTIVGDGPDRSQLEEQARALAIVDRIRWMGWQKDPWALDLSAHFLMLTSDYEGFPMVLLEALARGVPVLSTDCPTGPRDIVVPQKNGYLVPVHDPQAIAETLMGVVAQGELVQWSQAVMQNDVATRFGSDAVLSRIHGILSANSP